MMCFQNAKIMVNKMTNNIRHLVVCMSPAKIYLKTNAPYSHGPAG